tara:strand:- start:6582 stop:7022 length:441 start_codon:yes stop_codon:yes gene_type:complete
MKKYMSIFVLLLVLSLTVSPVLAGRVRIKAQAPDSFIVDGTDITKIDTMKTRIKFLEGNRLRLNAWGNIDGVRVAFSVKTKRLQGRHYLLRNRNSDNVIVREATIILYTPEGRIIERSEVRIEFDDSSILVTNEEGDIEFRVEHSF